MRVEIGTLPHPMAEEHYIEWVALVSPGRCDIRYLVPGDGPVAVFPSVEHGTVYAYCNLHGLWEAGF